MANIPSKPGSMNGALGPVMPSEAARRLLADLARFSLGSYNHEMYRSIYMQSRRHYLVPLLAVLLALSVGGGVPYPRQSCNVVKSFPSTAG